MCVRLIKFLLSLIVPMQILDNFTIQIQAKPLLVTRRKNYSHTEPSKYMFLVMLNYDTVGHHL